MNIWRTLDAGRQKFLLTFMFLIIISVVSVSFSMGSGEGYDPRQAGSTTPQNMCLYQ